MIGLRSRLCYSLTDPGEDTLRLSEALSSMTRVPGIEWMLISAQRDFIHVLIYYCISRLPPQCQLRAGTLTEFIIASSMPGSMAGIEQMSNNGYTYQSYWNLHEH